MRLSDNKMAKNPLSLAVELKHVENSVFLCKSKVTALLPVWVGHWDARYVRFVSGSSKVTIE